MIKAELAEAARLANEGSISQSIQTMEASLVTHGPQFSSLSNLAALHLQLGDIDVALRYCKSAISADPYSYVGYYNRFLCYWSKKSKMAARRELHKALSCLFMLRGFEQSDVKLLNKAVVYCEQNARAYLFRAKLKEMKNNKLAQNDYSAAIEYDPSLPQIYQQRAIFYRRLNRGKEFQENLATYHRLKQEGRSITELVDNEGVIEQEQMIIDEKIEEEVKIFQELLLRTYGKTLLTASVDHSVGVSKLPLSSIHSQIERKEEDQLLLSDRQQEGTAQTITIRKQEIQFKKRADNQKTGLNYRQIYEDESSGQIDKQINRIEGEIQMKGGKISTGRDELQELDVSDPSDFLTKQIEKAIMEITKLSTPEGLGDVRSVKSAGSQGSNANKDMSIEQFSHFYSIHIEIQYAEELCSSNKREQAKVQLRYGNRVFQTAMKKYEWNQDFDFPVSIDFTQIEISLIEKGTPFRPETETGEGTINLLERKNGKCILGNSERKIAILHYKVTLS